MGASSSCCNGNDALAEVQPQEPKIIGYNTQQKITEIKAYRFFINHLMTLMLVNNGVEHQEFYFIRKSWIKSWAKYTSYDKIRNLLREKEINNEIDFHKIILDHKNEINFEGFIEKDKPGPIRFFEINKLNTNIKENFYIFDSKILKQFIDLYEYEDNFKEGKEAFALKGEIGKGRIIFDVKEYTLIMFLNKDWQIKQTMVIFGTEAEHKHFVKSVMGRALTFISKELKKISQKKKMVIYNKDDIYVYDSREFVKYEMENHKNLYKSSKTFDTHIKMNEKKDKENLDISTNKKIKKSNIEFDKNTNLFEPLTKGSQNIQVKANIKFEKDIDNYENDDNVENKMN
jgi:hypothetical protein